MTDIVITYNSKFKEDAPYIVKFPGDSQLRFNCLEDADTIANLFKAIDPKHTVAFEEALEAAVFSGGL